jgi:hypothetical protein
MNAARDEPMPASARAISTCGLHVARPKFPRSKLCGSPAKHFDIGDRLIDFSLPLRHLGHDPRNRPAVARDDGLASLDLVEQPSSAAL